MADLHRVDRGKSGETEGPTCRGNGPLAFPEASPSSRTEPDNSGEGSCEMALVSEAADQRDRGEFVARRFQQQF